MTAPNPTSEASVSTIQDLSSYGKAMTLRLLDPVSTYQRLSVPVQSNESVLAF